jgi:hypothetical protein
MQVSIKKDMLVMTVIVIMAFLSGTFQNELKAQDITREKRNITAFNRLFGYVRYFHPSDEAQKIYWERFAIYGCQKVLPAQNDAALIKELRDLFSPIAPSVRIFKTADRPAFSVSSITPPDTNGFKLVSWQYLGLQTQFIDDYTPGVYTSIRLNRPLKTKIVKDTVGYSYLYQTIKTKEHSGHFIMKAKMRLISDHHAVGGMWISNAYTDGGTRHSRPEKNYDMSNNPVTDSSWKLYKLEGEIDSNGEEFVIGVNLNGKGKLFVKDLSLVVTGNGSSDTVPLKNVSFENSDTNGHLADWTSLPYNNYSYETITDNATAKQKVLKIAYIQEEQLKNMAVPLYPQKHAAGDTINREIVDGISCIVPLAVYGTDSFTWPRVDTVDLNRLNTNMLDATNRDLSADSLDVRLGNLVIGWNYYRHFFPFWSEASKPAIVLFAEALGKTFKDKSPTDFLQTLLLMGAPMNDGHIFITYDKDSSFSAAVPLIFARVKNEIVIKFILDSNLNRTISKGDVIDSIDHKTALEALQDKEVYISGSPQWKEFKGLIELANGYPKSSLTLVINRDGKKINVTVPRTIQGVGYRNGGFSDHPLKSGEVAKGLYYVNLLDTADVLTPLMKPLEQARSIIFDLRGYPSQGYASHNIFYSLLGHLLTERDKSRHILHTPQILYPDYEKVTYDDGGDVYQPETPHLNARIYFLSDASAGSFSENFMGYIKDFKLGTIIGQSTTGSNGNINVFYLPGGYSMTFTGMLVTNQNGNGSHLQGVTPDIPVNPTREGIRQGKDEIIETAIKMAEEEMQQ